MATAQTIINRSLRLIGAIASGESPTTDESNDALTALNAMLESWRNDRLTVYALQEVSKAMVVADSSYTIVSSGDFNTTRPIRIEHAFMRDAHSNEYPVEVIDAKAWYAIPDRTATSDIVEKVWYNPTADSSTGTINVWPVPSATNTLYLVLAIPFSTLGLSDTVTLPPGYEDAIAYNLALRIAPEYEKQPSPLVMDTARKTLAGIKRVNASTVELGTELPALLNPHRVNIITGV